MALTRREFLLIGTTAGAFAAVGVVVPVALTKDGDGGGGEAAVVGLFPRMKVASLSSLDTGDPVFFDYPLEGQSNLVVKMGEPATGGVGPDDDVVAYSNLCTHMGCPITDYEPDHRLLGPCPCHFTTFDLSRDAQVTLGQATQNLPRVLLEVEDDDVYATGVLRLVYGFSNTLVGAPAVA